VYSAGQVRDLAWTRPFDAVSRLSHETRRSNGSPEQQVSGRLSTARSHKVELILRSLVWAYCDANPCEGQADRCRLTAREASGNQARSRTSRPAAL
jgi:hypothetical protein